MIIGRAERWERLPGATPASRSDLPYQNDLTRAMRRSRSPFHPGGSQKLTQSDLSERPLQVAPEARSHLARVTPRGRSHFYRVTTTQWSRNDLSERPTEVAPKPGATLPERRGEVARVFIAQRHENGPGATSHSDPSRSLSKPGATSRSDYWSHQTDYLDLGEKQPKTSWKSLSL
ncbi:hypothetical protein F2Q69_00048936 [Brassica cretica]|uniref:Uncharacterized protein n=1 Tax=Brassica cretica TaxID=69181 RepID=A0A8S9PT41_BRACR|nr:hypothetical protein F2Q69_00048936 [Brassica cretica]